MSTTSYSPRTHAPASLYEGRKNEDDFGIGLDYDNALMQDENGYNVIFHTGLLSPFVPEYEGRTSTSSSYQPRPTVNP